MGAEGSGVMVAVEVAVAVGVSVEVAVGVSVGVSVGVAVSSFTSSELLSAVKVGITRVGVGVRDALRTGVEGVACLD